MNIKISEIKYVNKFYTFDVTINKDTINISYPDHDKLTNYRNNFEYMIHNGVDKLIEKTRRSKK